MPDCNSQVGRGTVTYPCNLPQGHDGPCSAREVAASIRIRNDWEQGRGTSPRHAAPEVASPRHAAPVAPVKVGVPTLESLGMQGPAKSAVDGLIAPEGRESRREHPDTARRRQNGTLQNTTLENELVRLAGGVDISKVGTSKPEEDPRMAFYQDRENQTRGGEYRNWEEPRTSDDYVTEILSRRTAEIDDIELTAEEFDQAFEETGGVTAPPEEATNAFYVVDEFLWQLDSNPFIVVPEDVWEAVRVIGSTLGVREE